MSHPDPVTIAAPALLTLVEMRDDLRALLAVGRPTWMMGVADEVLCDLELLIECSAPPDPEVAATRARARGVLEVCLAYRKET